jgi:hypothetical protein
MRRLQWIRIIAAGSALGFFVALDAAQAQAPTPNLPEVPEVYKFDSGWPKPLPNNWVIGTVTGMYVDRDDHIWVLDRPGPGRENRRPGRVVIRH